MSIRHRNDVHFTGERLTINRGAPFLMTVTIDNDDGGEYPDNPWTLNAYLGGDTATEEPLVLGSGGGALVEGTIPMQLRKLADLIEKGEVYR